jgi:hypothetical protein
MSSRHCLLIQAGILISGMYLNYFHDIASHGDKIHSYVQRATSQRMSRRFAGSESCIGRDLKKPMQINDYEGRQA